MKCLTKISMLTAALMLTGCTITKYGYDQQTYTNMIGQTYAPTEHVDVFAIPYGGGHQYKEIAFLKIEGDTTDNYHTLIANLKGRAASMGADAIIDLQIHEIFRETGIHLNDLIDVVTKTESEPEGYFTLSLEGIAVRYVDK